MKYPNSQNSQAKIIIPYIAVIGPGISGLVCPQRLRPAGY
jgi:predicted NAD/FAD-binding protein